MPHATTRTLLSLLLIVLLLSAAPAFAADHGNARRLSPPNEKGDLLYWIYLSLAAVAREPVENETPATSPRDPMNGKDFRAWHTPKVRALVRKVEEQYGIVATTMTSHIAPTFSAYVPQAALEVLRTDERIEKILPSYQLEGFSATPPPWSNQISGSETIPWGKIAIEANDGVSTGNTVYMIDAGFQDQGVNCVQLNAPPNPDLPFVYEAPVNCNWNGLPNRPHALHVAGILAANMNDYLVRGINPGATIVSVRRGSSTVEISQAIEWVLADTEYFGTYSVANLSSNGTDFAVGGDVYNWIQALSNRVLVVNPLATGLLMHVRWPLDLPIHMMASWLCRAWTRMAPP